MTPLSGIVSNFEGSHFFLQMSHNLTIFFNGVENTIFRMATFGQLLDNKSPGFSSENLLAWDKLKKKLPVLEREDRLCEPLEGHNGSPSSRAFEFFTASPFK
jgi:hypothetical protein